MVELPQPFSIESFFRPKLLEYIEGTYAEIDDVFNPEGQIQNQDWDNLEELEFLKYSERQECIEYLRNSEKLESLKHQEAVENLNNWMDWLDSKVGADEKLSATWDAVNFYRVCAENLYKLDALLKAPDARAGDIHRHVETITKYLAKEMPSKKREYLEDWWSRTNAVVEKTNY